MGSKCTGSICVMLRYRIFGIANSRRIATKVVQAYVSRVVPELAEQTLAPDGQDAENASQQRALLRLHQECQRLHEEDWKDVKAHAGRDGFRRLSQSPGVDR